MAAEVQALTSRLRVCEWCKKPGTAFGSHSSTALQDVNGDLYHHACIGRAKNAMMEMASICASSKIPVEITGDDEGYELIFDRSTWAFHLERTPSQANFLHKEMNFLFKK